MDDRRRYRKIYCRLWIHPTFQALSSDAKVVMLYLLTGPQTNRIGLFRLSLALAGEQNNIAPGKVKKCVAVVCQTFQWTYDEAAGVVWIPSWWKWNDVRENFKVFQGALADLHEVPETPLIGKFLAHKAFVPSGLQYLLNRLSEARAIPESDSNPGIQDQDQKQDQEQEQKQESVALMRQSEFPESAFDAFRNAYPASRRVGGKEGRRAFEGALNGREVSTHLPIMLAALEQHQRSEQWRNPKYIPLMTTWLNQERWTMVLPEAGQSDLTRSLMQANDDFDRLVGQK